VGRLVVRRSRRDFLRSAASTAVALSPLVGNNALAQTGFGAQSTAEMVTTGINLSGKTAVITGVNSGIGNETMRVLALRGARVIGTARSMGKAKAACRSVSGEAIPMALELSNFDSVVDAAAKIRRLDTPVDILICNAGVMALPDHEKVYGIEKQFVVNHLGHFLLVNQLLERVRISSQGRIIFLTTSAGRSTAADTIDFDNLSGDSGYSPLAAYAQSKLANALCSVELARRLGFSNPATSNSVYPGLVKTGIRRNMEGRTAEFMKSIQDSMGKSVEQGASTSCYVASNPALREANGRYFQDNQRTIPLRQMADVEMARKLWIVSEELTRPWFG
jgi:NAD(P)-dependent dehydrogenase (short-subunit alcohol dehydrogenase family)